jgi:pyruvate dehydrogenase E1 component alpha subunit
MKLSIQKDIDTKVRQDIDKATKEAKADPEINLEELAADIYALNLEPQIRGIVSGDTIRHPYIGAAVNK